MDVAGAALDGVRENQVDQFNDGCFFRRLFQCRRIQVLLVTGQFEVGIFLVSKVLHHLAERFIVTRVAVELRNGFGNSGLRSHYWLNIEPGHKLDIVHREDVGRIGHGDGEGRADARQRHNLIPDGRVLGDQLDDILVHFVVFQIDRGHTILAREHAGNLVVGDVAQLHQDAAQFAAVMPLMLQSFLKLLCRNQVLFD